MYISITSEWHNDIKNVWKICSVNWKEGEITPRREERQEVAFQGSIVGGIFTENAEEEIPQKRETADIWWYFQESERKNLAAAYGTT